MLIIVACRFIPGGRTAVTLTCGLIGYPRRRFVIATAVAGIVSSYAFFLGRLGGKAFEDRPWIGLLLALRLALAVSVLIEAARRALRWFISARNRTRQRLSADHRQWPVGTLPLRMAYPLPSATAVHASL
jgi:membrane-associated protein